MDDLRLALCVEVLDEQFLVDLLGSDDVIRVSGNHESAGWQLLGGEYRFFRIVGAVDEDFGAKCLAGSVVRPHEVSRISGTDPVVPPRSPQQRKTSVREPQDGVVRFTGC